MAMVFPTSPTVGQVFTSGGRSWVWNGSTWDSPAGQPAVLPGLVLLKTQAIGSGVTSVAVSDAFSSNFDKYRIIVDSAASLVEAFRIRFNNSSGSTYQSFGFYQQWNSTNMVGEVATGQTSGVIATQQSTKFSFISDIIDPFLATPTQVMCTSLTPQYWAPRAIHDSAAVSNTGFTIFPNTGTITGGTIAIYGYRK